MANARDEAERSEPDWPQPDLKRRQDSIAEIARRLDELLRDMADIPKPDVSTGGGALLDAARRAQRDGQLRARVFGTTLSTSLDWDLLLDLFVAREEERPVTLQSIRDGRFGDEASVLRCLAYLVKSKLVSREFAPSEPHVVNLALTEDAAMMMRDYLSQASLDRDEAAE